MIKNLNAIRRQISLDQKPGCDSYIMGFRDDDRSDDRDFDDDDKDSDGGDDDASANNSIDDRIFDVK